MQESKYYKVTWLDHFSESEWKSKSEIAEMVEDRRDPCITVGEITFENEEMIVMSASYDGDDNYGDHMAIFKNCIINRELLQIVYAE